MKYPPKYSVGWIAKRLNGSSSKLLRDRFPHIKEWCPGHLWALSCYHPKIMPYIWFDLTTGVVLVITGMILFYLRKGTEKAIKNG